MAKSAVIALATVLAAVALFSTGVAAEEKVLTLTSKNFDDTLKQHPFVVVEFYAPWCGHCKALAPEYEKAAAALEGDMSAGVPITLAKVDATEERALAEKFNIGGYPTLKIFTEGSDKPMDYEGPRQADDIVSYLKKRAGPASAHLTDAEKAAALKESEKVLVVYAGKNFQEWTKVANSMRDAATWVHTDDKNVMSKLGVKDGVTVLKKFDEGSVEFTGAVTDIEKLKEFVNTHRRQVAMPIKKGDQDALKIIFEDESTPNVFLFTAGGDDEIAAFKDGCKKYRSDFISGYFLSTDFAEAFQHFGMDKHTTDNTLPKVLIDDRKEGNRYIMDDKITKASIQKFLSDFKDGKLTPFLKSEEVPKDNDGPVKVIVGSTFQKEVNNTGKWVFLEAYAPWCGHCKKLAPVWDDLGEAFKGTSVIIAKVDATANDLPKSLGVRGFPTLLLFKGDGSAPINYDGERDFAALSKFVTSKTGAKVPKDFKPKTPSTPSASLSLDKQIIKFLATDFQVPWMSAGYKVSGLYLAAICIFLLFVAAIALVVAIMSKDSSAPAAKPEKKKEVKKE